ncbi:hypothetical protein DTO013E5_1381 [Penicillium roqueforti]|nr:hypothetical protein LCP963914a_2097 [Penicillium roqueforti]KAI2745269.1 hypothetical protein DTO012A1_1908 [Penicillium roqueforti]KAI2754098.1 hypothetical protein DTO013F2_1924 [Penicillium roqueforti]KAI2773417.1 hypothetical protein DTO012A8_2162 [Penicillium roqueforti]KAI3078918.1 hypothetical protein CBS147339_4038 [Penicillium roqueforti]
MKEKKWTKSRWTPISTLWPLAMTWIIMTFSPSAIARGRLENGRRYQAIKEDDYWGPSDEQQFEAFEIGHLMFLVLDHDQPNPLFRSPIGASPKNILDIGTGQGSWAIDVADRYPLATVRGVDLFPPPVLWMPPN